ncbi:MAG TPA: PorV/PorQ family protein [bacterium]|nr:PorV/PorQ family protein [bacterium]
MKKLVYMILAFALGAGIVNQAQGQISMKKLGQSTMNFLAVSVSPRATAMGNAYTAVSSEAEATFYNPAGLARLTSGYSAMFSRTQWIADINYTAAAVARSFGNTGSFGLSLLSVDYGDIEGTQLLSRTDPQGFEKTGVIDNVGAYAIGLTYGRQISSQFAIGGEVQFASQQLGDNPVMGTTNRESKIVYNFGINFRTGFESLNFAMAIRNFATSVKYEEITAQLPLNFMFGVSMNVLDLFMQDMEGTEFLVSTEFTHPNNYTERVNVGGELVLFDIFLIRTGYQFNRDIGNFSGGFGIAPSFGGNRLELNYAYIDTDIFGGVNQFSLNVKF